MTGGQDMWQHVGLSFPTFPFCICIVPCWNQSREADPSTHHPRGARGHSLPAGDFSPSPRSRLERQPRILPGSRERSSCPLLYLLHLTNLMTGGMRSISNMASLAGSGQSTQEPFLHTPIPAGCRSLLPRASRCCLPRAGWDRHSRLSPSCLSGE